jgi:7,8-dihydroneopterin aldolase/epimerase/oxygenase
MTVSIPLLEQLAERVVADIRKRWPFVLEISLGIFKLSPPLANFQGKVGITLLKKFEDR